MPWQQWLHLVLCFCSSRLAMGPITPVAAAMAKVIAAAAAAMAKVIAAAAAAAMAKVTAAALLG